jgi:hypothetical protein
MSEIVIGTDLGSYTPSDNGYTITLNDIGYDVKLEDILHIENLTQGVFYYKLAERVYCGGKKISILNNVISILGGNVGEFHPVQANDKIRIKIKRVVNDANPAPVKDIDPAGRMSLNTVFGEKIHAIRKADIAAQFQYGFPASSANAEILNGGTISIIDSMLTLNTGTNIAGLAAISNKKALRYIPGHEAFLFFTSIFTEGKANSSQRAGLFDSENGFFLGYEGTDFCVTRRRDGVDYNHSIDISQIYIDGSFDPTKGNVYRISFGYLGFATIHFEVMLPGGGWTKLYEIEYPNTETETHILNTNLQPRVEVVNTGNNTDIQFQTGSFEAGVANGGGKDPAARRFTFSLPDITITAGAYNAVTFRSRATFNSLTNYIQTIFTLMSLTTGLNKASLWEFRKDMTITNVPTWTDINTTDSIIEYSTDAVLTTGTGTVSLAFTMGTIDRLFQEIESQEIELFPQETITIVLNTPAGTNGTIDLSMRWKELF